MPDTSFNSKALVAFPIYILCLFFLATLYAYIAINNPLNFIMEVSPARTLPPLGDLQGYLLITFIVFVSYCVVLIMAPGMFESNFENPNNIIKFTISIVTGLTSLYFFMAAYIGISWPGFAGSFTNIPHLIMNPAEIWHLMGEMADAPRLMDRHGDTVSTWGTWFFEVVGIVGSPLLAFHWNKTTELDENANAGKEKKKYLCSEINLSHPQMLELKNSGHLDLTINHDLTEQIAKEGYATGLNLRSVRFYIVCFLLIGIFGFSTYMTYIVYTTSTKDITSTIKDCAIWFIGALMLMTGIWHVNTRDNSDEMVAEDARKQLLDAAMKDSKLYERVKISEGWIYYIEESEAKKHM
jgi:hypothetical protein